MRTLILSDRVYFTSFNIKNKIMERKDFIEATVLSLLASGFIFYRYLHKDPNENIPKSILSKIIKSYVK